MNVPRSKTVVLDHGRDNYSPKALADFAKQGVHIVRVTPFSPQNKGAVERAMRALETGQPPHRKNTNSR